MGSLARAWARLDAYFWAPADGRAYALVRIGFSIAALLNWLELFQRRQQFFGPRSMVDVGHLLQVSGDQPYLSAFYFANSDAIVTALFAVSGIGIVSLGFGAATRTAAAVVFAWHVSYSHAAFPILHGWDSLLRVYSFLLLISPAPTRWSLDSRKRRQDDTTEAGPPAYALRLMQWQLLVVYLATVWLKVDDPQWRNGQLVALFQMSLYGRWSDATWLANAEIVASVLTYTSLAIEASVVFLLANGRTRWLGFVLGVSLHAGIALSARLTVFSLAILAPYAAFLDTRNLDALTALSVRSYRAVARMVGRSTPSQA